MREIHRSPVNSPHKGQWRGALMFSLICVWINGWVNNREAGDLRRYRAHYDITVMETGPNKTKFLEPLTRSRKAWWLWMSWRQAGVRTSAIIMLTCYDRCEEYYKVTFAIPFMSVSVSKQETPQLIVASTRMRHWDYPFQRRMRLIEKLTFCRENLMLNALYTKQITSLKSPNHALPRTIN